MLVLSQSLQMKMEMGERAEAAQPGVLYLSLEAVLERWTQIMFFMAGRKEAMSEIRDGQSDCITSHVRKTWRPGPVSLLPIRTSEQQAKHT